MFSTTTISQAQLDAFYTAGLIALRQLDSREGDRRFSIDADARWQSFAGELTETDRMELVFRDAAVPFGSGFSGASAFRLGGVPADEAFGSAWPRMDRHRARRLLSESAASASWPPAEALREAAGILNLGGGAPRRIEVGLADRLLVVGERGLLDAALAILGNQDLDWARQVVTLADEPGVRQLAGLVSVFAQSKSATVFASDQFSPKEPILDALERLTGSARLDLVVDHGGGSPAVRDIVRQLRDQAPTVRFA